VIEPRRKSVSIFIVS